MSNDDAIQKLPLRQRKFARTKVGLLRAALSAMESRPLDEITVKELCEAIPISEASFFNYFPRKTDLIVYYVQLWSLEMEWHARERLAEAGALAAIEGIFTHTARVVEDTPQIMREIIGGQVRMQGKPELGEVTFAERLMTFPNLHGIEKLKGKGLNELLAPLVGRARECGELPEPMDCEVVVASLRAIFFGTPVAHFSARCHSLEAAYLNHLRLLWAGLRTNPLMNAT